VTSIHQIKLRNVNDCTLNKWGGRKEAPQPKKKKSNRADIFKMQYKRKTESKSGRGKEETEKLAN
jgi:hypothetical protein